MPHSIEVDIDYLVNDLPVFNLQDLPPTAEDFLKCIGFDSYGHRAHTANTPVRHRYTSRQVPPSYPPASEQLIDAYKAAHAGQHLITLMHQFEEILESPAQCEMVRLHFYQAILGSILRCREVGAAIRTFSIPGAPKPAANLVQMLGLYLIKLAVTKCQARLDFDKHGYRNRGENIVSWQWPRSDLCVLWANHLEDEANVQASVADLFTRALQDKPASSNIVYGVVTSIFHVIIVRMDFSSVGKESFRHTPTLQFLPSPYAKSSSTPGISALIRLGYALLRRDLQHISSSPTYFGESRNPHSIIRKVPEEVWSAISSMLFQPAELAQVRLLSRQSKMAVERILMYPLLWEPQNQWSKKSVVLAVRLMRSSKTNVPDELQLTQALDVETEDLTIIEEPAPLKARKKKAKKNISKKVKDQIYVDTGNAGEQTVDHSHLSSASFEMDGDLMGPGDARSGLPWPPFRFTVGWNTRGDIVKFSTIWQPMM